MVHPGTNYIGYYKNCISCFTPSPEEDCSNFDQLQTPVSGFDSWSRKTHVNLFRQLRGVTVFLSVLRFIPMTSVDLSPNLFLRGAI